MAFSWVGFRDAYVADQERQREDELRLERKMEVMLPALLERRNQERQAARDAATKLGYLSQRGLSQEAQNALYSNPGALDAVFQEASAGKWVDWDADRLNTEIRGVSNLAGSGMSWQESIQEVNNLYADLDIEDWSEENYGRMQEMVYAPPMDRGSAVVEIRGSAPERISSEELTLFQRQAEVFDEKVTDLANRELDLMVRTGKNSRGEAVSESDIEQLSLKISEYNSNPAFKVDLREAYGLRVIDFLEQDEAFAPFAAGMRRNPYLFNPEGQVAVGAAPSEAIADTVASSEYVVGNVYEDETGTKWRKTATGWERVDG